VTEPPPFDLSTQAAQLSIQVEGLSASVSALARKQRRDRTLIRWTVAGLCVSLVALVLVGVVAVRANQAADRADSAYAVAEANRQAARLTCEANNQSRATQIELWTYVLELSAQSNPAPTREQAKRIAQFRTYIQHVFAPRDCSKPVTPTAPVPTPTGTR
jgi:hypothetical protein